jgi:hypothetical protein
VQSFAGKHLDMESDNYNRLTVAEILGVVVGIAGAADVGARVSKQLRKIVHRWRNAPSEIYAISNELSDLNVVLRSTGDALESIKTVPASTELKAALKDHPKSPPFAAIYRRRCRSASVKWGT